MNYRESVRELRGRVRALLSQIELAGKRGLTLHTNSRLYNELQRALWLVETLQVTRDALPTGEGRNEPLIDGLCGDCAGAEKRLKLPSSDSRPWGGYHGGVGEDGAWGETKVAEIDTTDKEKQDLQNAVTLFVAELLVDLDQSSDLYLEIGAERREATLSFGDEPGTDELLSNQFECVVDGEEWEDVLVVTVQHVRRRAIES